MEMLKTLADLVTFPASVKMAVATLAIERVLLQ
jgi:hypothetical protein